MTTFFSNEEQLWASDHVVDVDERVVDSEDVQSIFKTDAAHEASNSTEADTKHMIHITVCGNFLQALWTQERMRQLTLLYY